MYRQQAVLCILMTEERSEEESGFDIIEASVLQLHDTHDACRNNDYRRIQLGKMAGFLLEGLHTVVANIKFHTFSINRSNSTCYRTVGKIHFYARTKSHIWRGTTLKWTKEYNDLCLKDHKE